MYGRFAKYYDLIYRKARKKDYASEASQIADIIRSYIPNAAAILDVACGIEVTINT